MIESQTNGHSNGKEAHQFVKFKINHPKLHHQTFSFSRLMPFQLVERELKRDNMLSLFNNFHFQHEEVPLINEKDYAQLLKLTSKEYFELEVVFEHYKYASAMYHFKSVNQLLKNPNKLNSIYRNNQKAEVKGSKDLDMQQLTAQLVPQPFRGYKWNIDEVISPNYRGDLHQGRNEKQQFVHFLQYSGFNPPPSQAQFAGDYFYLHLKTLQNMDLHITACANGFYLNQSKISCYNPFIQNGKSTYISLLDLLTASSERFSASLNRVVEANPQSLLEKLWRKSSTIISNNVFEQNKWLDNADNEHHWNSRKQLSLRDLQGALEDHKDWNQQFVELSRMGEKLASSGEEGEKWQAQAYRQLYNEFTQAATSAARRILQGKVKAINYMDEQKRHIYIYNKIFMSATTETPYDHKLSKEEEVLPSSSSVSTDILNLQRLNSLKPKGLRLLQTLLISYRGWRMLVQTIIPGLLTSQLNAITLYGALDDSKSIQADERFRDLLLPICKQLHLEQNVQAIDKSQETVKIAVSPEIKGIKSTSGEYFLCDLQKFSPRDLNYLGLQQEGCVLRHRLLNQYIEDNQIDFSTAPSINPNIGTQTLFVPGPHHQEQQNFLKNVAKYLKQTAVPKLINALKSKNPGDFLTDSVGISSVFHEFGINMRYLGFVQHHEQLKENIEVRICLTRVILVRSLKHLFRSVLRNSGPLHLASAVSHILNCIFARKSILNQLSAVEEVVEQRVEANESKRKKKRKNREEEKEVKVVVNDQNRSIKSQTCRYLTMKPQEVWEEVCKIAKARFDFQFESTIFAFQQKGLFRLIYQKYASLRDLSLCIGLVIERKDYPLAQTDTSDSPPFTPKNILYFNTISKTIHLNPSSQLLTLKSEADRLFTLCSYKEAKDAYTHIVNLIRQCREGETLLSYCLGQVSRIEYMLGNLREAIVIETENLVFSQKTGRQDCLEVTRCYSRLGLYCMSLGAKQLSLWLLYKGLHLMLISFGEAYPDILINFANIARVHQQNREPTLASGCYIKAIELLTQVYGGKNHVNTSFCYSSLASLYYELGEYRKSADYQGEAVSILQKVLPTEDGRYIDAMKIHKMYREFCNSKGGSSRAVDHNSRDRKK